jgi:adenylate cyclase
MGDAIMAFWNAPLQVEGHRSAALDAAVQMTRRLELLNSEAGYNIRIGIGLNTGECLVGNLGSSQRFSYSAIGDAVNVASRIEGITKYYGLTLLFEQSVLDDATVIPEHHRALEVDLVRVVGRDTPLVLHTLVDRRRLTDEPAFFDAHAAFLNAYREGDFETALQRATQLSEEAPETIQPMYRTFRDRLQEILADPPEHWDGTFDFTEK